MSRRRELGSVKTWQPGILLGLAAALVGIRLPGVPGSAISLGLVLAALLIASASDQFRRISRFQITSVDLFFMFWILIRTTSELISAQELNHDISQAAYREPLIWYASFVATRLAVQSREEALIFLRGFLSPAVFVSLVAVLQLLDVGPIRQLLLSFVDGEAFERRVALEWSIRATSTIGHHTALGGFLFVVIVGALAGLVIARATESKHLFFVVVIVSSLVGQLAALTFAPIVASLVVIWFSLGRSLEFKRIRNVSIVAAATGFVILLDQIVQRLAQQAAGSFSLVPETLEYRWNIWVNETVPAAGERLSFGWGTEVFQHSSLGWPNYPAMLEWPSPESEYLRTLVAYGVAALVVQLLLYGLVWHKLRRARAFGVSEVTPVLAGWLALLLLSLIHSHLNNAGVPLAIWPLLGLFLSLGIQGGKDFALRSAPLLARQVDSR